MIAMENDAVTGKWTGALKHLSNSYKDRLLAKESKIDTECQT
jgi:hypothetical protein